MKAIVLKRGREKSVLRKHPWIFSGAIAEVAASGRPFMLESDYMDERSRPGAVVGPKSVPRTSLRLLASGALDEEALARCHVVTPSRVYGVEIAL